MPLRSVKMKRFILGFQRRVWCPKWTPLSSSWRMVTTAMCALLFRSARVARAAGPVGRHAPAGWPTPGACGAPRRLPGRSRTGRYAPPRGDGLRAREVGRTCRPHDQGTRPDPRRPNRLPGRVRRAVRSRETAGHGRARDDVSLPDAGLCGRVAAPDRGRWRQVARSANLLDADGAVAPTVFAEMSGLAARTGAINLGQGFPDTDGPAEPARGRGRGDPRRAPTSTRPGRGIPELRAAVAEHQRRFYGLDAGPRHRGAGHGGRDGGDRRRRPRARAARATRWSSSSRTTTPTRPYRARRRGAHARSPLRAPGLPPRRSTRSPPPSTPHPAGPAQHPAQPDRARCSPAPSSRRSRGVAVEHDAAGRDRRGVRAPASSTGSRARADRDPARHGRADPDDLDRGQDVLVHRLEDRLGHRAEPSWSTAVTHRQAVPDVRERRAVPAGRRVRRLRAAGRPPSADAARLAAGRPGPAVRGLLEARVRRRRPRGTYFVVADAAPLGYADGWPCAGTSPGSRGWSPCRSGSSTTTPRPGRHSCASPCASGRRSSPRRRGACGRCGGSRVVHKGRGRPAVHSLASAGCPVDACWSRLPACPLP